MVLLGRIIAISTCPLWCPSNPREIREWPRQQQQDRLLQCGLPPPRLTSTWRCLYNSLPCTARSLHSATAHTRTCSPRLPPPTIGGQEWLDNNKSSFSGEAVPRLENCTYMPRTAPPRVSLPLLRTRTEHHRGVHPAGFSRFSYCSLDMRGGDISRLSMWRCKCGLRVKPSLRPCPILWTKLQ